MAYSKPNCIIMNLLPMQIDGIYLIYKSSKIVILCSTYNMDACLTH